MFSPVVEVKKNEKNEMQLKMDELVSIQETIAHILRKFDKRQRKSEKAQKPQKCKSPVL